MASLAKHLRKQAVGVVDWYGFIKVKMPAIAAHLWELLLGEQLRRSRRARTRRLEIEVLEARIQLSTLIWTGEAGAFQPFSQLTDNWRDLSTGDHPVKPPGAGDDLKFDGSTILFPQ
jgi:hypothetical protein